MNHHAASPAAVLNIVPRSRERGSGPRRPAANRTIRLHFDSIRRRFATLAGAFAFIAGTALLIVLAANASAPSIRFTGASLTVQFDPHAGGGAKNASPHALLRSSMIDHPRGPTRQRLLLEPALPSIR